MGETNGKSNVRLVWSDEAPQSQKDQRKISKDQDRNQNSTQVTIDPKQFTAVFRIEKGGRGGKTVTVIDQLPRNETFLKELCRELKSKCGSGGTFSLSPVAGKIEIQGDKREAIKSIFKQKGFSFKGM